MEFDKHVDLNKGSGQQPPAPEAAAHQPGAPQDSGAPSAPSWGPPPGTNAPPAPGFGQPSGAPQFGGPPSGQVPPPGQPGAGMPGPGGPGQPPQFNPAGPPPAGYGSPQQQFAGGQPPKSNKGLIIGGIAAVAVLALIGAIFGIRALIGGGSKPSPSGGSTAVSGDTPEQAKPVVDYLNALANGDADAIKNAGWATVPSQSDSDALLTSAVLKAAKNKVTDAKITDAGTVYGDSAYIKATYKIGDKDFSANYATEKVDGKWKMKSDDVNTLYIRSGLDSIVVNGVAVTMPPDEDTITLAAYPAEYTITAPDSTLVTAPAKTAYVGDGFYAPSSELAATLTPQGLAQVQSAVNAFVASCAKAPASSTDCPLYSLEGTKWTITRNAVVKLGYFSDGRWSVSTSTLGKANYTRTSYGYKYSGSQTFSVYGYARVTGNKVIFEKD